MIGQFLAVALLVAVLLAHFRLTLIVLLACFIALVVLGIGAMAAAEPAAVGAGSTPRTTLSESVTISPVVTLR